MRSILEKALIALLNEDKDQADALFHNFILERSRQIHESLRQGEDLILDENWEQKLAIDEMFTDEDLVDENELAEADEDEVDTDEVGDDQFDGVTDDESSDEADVDGTDDGDVAEVEPEAIEDRVEDLEAQLQSLAAEFDAIMGTDEVADEFAGDDAGDTGEVDVAGEFDAEIDGLSADDSEDELKEDDFLSNADEDEDEEYGNLGESIVDSLEDVNVKHAEGLTTASSDKATVNSKSVGLSKSGEQRQAGEPVKIKSTEHNGFDLESAPKSDTFKARRNTVKKATDGQSSVSKEGDKSAVLNTLGDDKSAQKGLFNKKMN